LTRGDVRLIPQQGRCLHDAADHLEHAALGLFEIVGDDVTFGVAAAV
jgi:hypothetical protein